MKAYSGRQQNLPLTTGRKNYPLYVMFFPSIMVESFVFLRAYQGRTLNFSTRVCSIRFYYVLQIAVIFLSKMDETGKKPKIFSKCVKNLTSEEF